MFERLKNNRRLLLVLLATLITQGLIFLLVYNVNLIPSWEIGCAVVCVIIYLAIGYVYFITLRRIFRWLIKGIKKWYAVSLSLLYSLLMYGWLVAGLFFTLLFYILGSDTLFDSYAKTIRLPVSGQEIYLYKSEIMGEMTAVYIRQDKWPVKKKLVTMLGAPGDVSITESDSMIYISGFNQIYECNRFLKTIRGREK